MINIRSYNSKTIKSSFSFFTQTSSWHSTMLFGGDPKKQTEKREIVLSCEKWFINLSHRGFKIVEYSTPQYGNIKSYVRTGTGSIFFIILKNRYGITSTIVRMTIFQPWTPYQRTRVPYQMKHFSKSSILPKIEKSFDYKGTLPTRKDDNCEYCE